MTQNAQVPPVVVSVRSLHLGTLRFVSEDEFMSIFRISFTVNTLLRQRAYGAIRRITEYAVTETKSNNGEITLTFNIGRAGIDNAGQLLVKIKSELTEEFRPEFAGKYVYQ